jgi:hypothetical protein
MERNPYWDMIVTYEGQDYPLDLNTLTMREHILITRKTGLDRQQFLDGFFTNQPEPALAAVWLALHRALGDDAPAYDTVDVEALGDWIRLADPDAAVAWSVEKAKEAEAADEAAADPTPLPDPEPTD